MGDCCECGLETERRCSNCDEYVCEDCEEFHLCTGRDTSEKDPFKEEVKFKDAKEDKYKQVNHFFFIFILKNFLNKK